TCTGIPPEDLPRIFERFYRVDKSRAATKGYGLGLTISKEIVQAHKGAISVESVVNLGTKFTVRLPVTQSTDTTVVRRKT
ncbi:MAG: two-component sensor histidine kinase, partial [Chloroflexi bacterium]|nr:two-component sensor histidine kinase [Chloroflexota bacterium]